MTDQKPPNTTLRSIYEEDGTLPDMSKLDPKGDPRWAKSFGYFVGILVLGTAVAWLGFRLFIPSNPGDVVLVKIDAPEHVTAGAKMKIVLHYENNDRSPLALAVLKARLPKEFVPESALPRSDDDTLTSWTLGTLDRGAKGDIEIQGRALGAIGTNAQIQSTLTYKPASFNAEFTSLANRSFVIDTAPIEITFDGPSEASAGQSVVFTVRYKNTSDAALANTQIVFIPGASFSVTKTSKKPLHDTTWALPALEPGAVGEMSITGAVTSSAEVATVLPFQVITQVKREDIVLAKAAYELTVTQGDLALSIERDDTDPVRMGDTISGRIIVANNSSVPIGDINIQLTSPNSIDWGMATSAVKISSSKGGVAWSGSGVEKLKLLPATERFSIPFTIKAPATTDLSEVVFSASAKALKRNNTAAILIAKSADFSIAISSHISADGVAMYYDMSGLPVGAGPLPPRVGEETKYRVQWKIKNGSRDLADVTLSALLGENVVFGTKQGVGAGAIIFDADTRTVRWAMSRLPSNVSEVIAQFDVVLTPVTNDQGKTVELLAKGVLTATDPLITDPVNIEIPHLTTDLVRDQKAVGRGVVLP